MIRVLTPTLAVLFVLALTAPTVAADDPPGLAERMERIGKLPAELVKAKKTDAEITDALFFATVARLPTDKEKEFAAKHLSAAKDREEAARDLAWALVNTKEFIKLQGFENKDVAVALQRLNVLVEKWGKEEKEKK